MEQKYLPIGSVCTLKGKNKKIMVTGYYSVEFNGNLKINDYVGYAYPEGMLLPSTLSTFNHDDIEHIDFVGYKNDEQKVFLNLLNQLTGNDLTEEEKAANFSKQNDMFLTSNSVYSKLLFDENGVVMIAEPVEQKAEEKIEFDEDGYVINTESSEEINNPFYKEYENNNVVNSVDSNEWTIFNKFEFDENGTVIEVNNGELTSLNEIKFDENGVVIAINGDTLKEEQNNNKYNFDANGNVISMNDVENEEKIPPIGPGLPGYVKPENKKVSNYQFDADGNVITQKTYEFDVNGNLVSMDNEQQAEEIIVNDPSTPNYVATHSAIESNGYQFDADGNVVASPQSTIRQVEQSVLTNIQFDENGTVVSV